MDEIVDFIVFCHITRIVGANPGRDQCVKVFYSPNVILWDIFDVVCHQLILDPFRSEVTWFNQRFILQMCKIWAKVRSDITGWQVRKNLNFWRWTIYERMEELMELSHETYFWWDKSGNKCCFQENIPTAAWQIPSLFHICSPACIYHFGCTASEII